MNGAAPNAFSLDVDSTRLTRALNYLRKFEPRTEFVHLKYDSGMLIVSIGRTSRDVPATGAWPSSVSVGRTWAKALTEAPFEAAITTLRIAEGRLWARNFGVEYSLDPRLDETEETLNRQDDISTVCQILASHKVAIQEIGELIDQADRGKASLWGPGDGRIIDDVASAWKQLASYGVQASAIRSLLDSKSRELWRSGTKVDSKRTRPSARYEIAEQDTRDLIGSADSRKARPWGPADSRLIDEVALAWKQLVLYGVEPSEILCLLDRKLR
jgi:hypothetical protein